MLFVIFTGEEKGLLGSRYFAGRPTVPETEIVADLNLDMFMPLFALKKLHVQGLAESTLAEDARAVGAAHGIEIAPDPEPDRNSFTRTESIRFCAGGGPGAGDEVRLDRGFSRNTRRGGNGWRSGTTRRKTIFRSLFDTAAAAQFDSFLGDLARRVADSPNSPALCRVFFFHRFEK